MAMNPWQLLNSGMLGWSRPYAGMKSVQQPAQAPVQPNMTPMNNVNPWSGLTAGQAYPGNHFAQFLNLYRYPGFRRAHFDTRYPNVYDGSYIPGQSQTPGQSQSPGQSPAPAPTPPSAWGGPTRTPVAPQTSVPGATYLGTGTPSAPMPPPPEAPGAPTSPPPAAIAKPSANLKASGLLAQAGPDHWANFKSLLAENPQLANEYRTRSGDTINWWQTQGQQKAIADLFGGDVAKYNDWTNSTSPQSSGVGPLTMEQMARLNKMAGLKGW